MYKVETAIILGGIWSTKKVLVLSFAKYLTQTFDKSLANLLVHNIIKCMD